MKRSADQPPRWHPPTFTNRISHPVARTLAALTFWLPLVAFLATATPAMPNDIVVKPMGNWLEHREAEYKGKPLLIHLRTGYERAIVFPEPIRLSDPDQTLPDCDLVIDLELLGFYPKRSFGIRVLKLTGLETGITYELRVRSSPQGIRQPLRITR